MANSKTTKEVVTEEQLTKDELAKVKVGICPKCGEALGLYGLIEVDPDGFMMIYDEESGEWESGEDVELNYIYQGLQCQGFRDCPEFDVSIVQPDE